MKNSFLAILTSIFSAATPVLAQTDIPVESEFPEEYNKSNHATGFYVTAGVGGSWAGSPSVKALGISGSADLGGGVAAEGGFGYDFGNTRSELTYTYNSFPINRYNIACFSFNTSETVSYTHLTLPTICSV